MSKSEDGKLIYHPKKVPLIEDIDHNNFHSIDLTDYSLDELCQIHKTLLGEISDYFHDGLNQESGYITLMCEKIMAEIKNQLLYMAI